MNNVIEFPKKEIRNKDMREEFSQRLKILSEKKYDLLEYIEGVENYGHLMLSDQNHPLNNDELLGCDLYNIIKYYFSRSDCLSDFKRPSV